MASREQLITALRNADAAGDSAAAQRFAQMIQGQPEVQQETGLLQDIYGAGETAAAMVSGAIAEPIAGVSGIGAALNPFEEREAGTVVEDVKDAFTFEPRTESGRRQIQAVGKFFKPLADILTAAETAGGELGYDIAGPIGGAIGETLPTAALEALGLAGPKAAAKVAGRQAGIAGEEAATLSKQAEDIMSPQATDAGLEVAAESITKGKPVDIAEMVQASPAFYKAADELGINTEPLASFASKNPQFRSLEQGLASIPASQLDAQSKQFIGEVSQKADDLIEQYGGTKDKAELSQRFETESLKSIDDIYAKEGDLYDSIAAQIPKDAEAFPIETIAFLEKRASELGGVDNLAPSFKRLYNQFYGKDVKPTNELLNQRRKEVGQQLGRKGDTQFKNTETGELKQLYAVMKADQESIAKASGISDVVESANAMTIQRKQIEDNLKGLLGKNLQKDLMPVVGSSLKQLGKGKTKQWRETMASIPKEFRQEVVVSALNDIFRGSGASQQAFNPTQFTKFMNELNRSPQTKALLYKELPKESIKSIENLYTLSKGIQTALQDKIPTGRVAALFDNNNGFLRRLMGKGATAAATLGGGPLAGSVVSDFLSQASDGAKSASSMLSTPQFQRIIRESVKEGVVDGAMASDKLKAAEKAFSKSKQYKAWEKTLTESDKLRLSSLGLTNYLFQEQDEAQQ